MLILKKIKECLKSRRYEEETEQYMWSSKSRTTWILIYFFHNKNVINEWWFHGTGFRNGSVRNELNGNSNSNRITNHWGHFFLFKLMKGNSDRNNYSYLTYECLRFPAKIFLNYIIFLTCTGHHLSIKYHRYLT